MKKVIGTKAQTLQAISKNLPLVKVLPVFILKVNDFLTNKKECVQKIQSNFVEQKLIVRSSSRSEDTLDNSNAGHYTSLLDISKDNDIELIEAINKVIESYDNSINEEVLIQPMMKDIVKSGVVFTADIDTLAPYYVLNYHEGDRSDAVTSGGESDLRTLVVYKEKEIELDDLGIKRLLENCRHLEAYFENQYLDIEFGINKSNEVVIFQVRPLANQRKMNGQEVNIHAIIRKMYKKVEKLSRSHPNLLGNKTAFGVMPDWNPAEIIGVRPKRLAMSLYKELITDQIWAHQRADYGYRNLKGHPLMVSFAGLPYIDVRITINSFIPKSLHEDIAERLAEYYINKLIEKPNYHDKVEFEIVHSCYYLDLGNKLKELEEKGFNENEIKRIEFALLDLTNKIINPHSGLYKKDIEKIKVLEKKYNQIINSHISIIDKIYWLIEDCKQWGTLPFAGIARAAFIAVQFVKSFVSLGIITKEEYDYFMNSLNTVNKTMNKDIQRVFNKELSVQEFLDEYGHIRPGTYDITSARYDEKFDVYFSKDNYVECNDEFIFSKEKLDKIDKILIENGLEINSKDLMTFIKEAIEGREYAKFKFTKSLSQVLVLIEEMGRRYNISREEMSYIDIQVIKNLYSSVDCADLEKLLKDNIRANKELYEYTRMIKLPSIITEPEDIFRYYLLEEEPNFITLKEITGLVVQEQEVMKNTLEGKIVFIKSADPGYDFIFTKNIGGLVTQFGGANSHMAIRCAELGIPAVIGAGEKKYSSWSKSSLIKLDCLSKKVIELA